MHATVVGLLKVEYRTVEDTNASQNAEDEQTSCLPCYRTRDVARGGVGGVSPPMFFTCRHFGKFHGGVGVSHPPPMFFTCRHFGKFHRDPTRGKNRNSLAQEVRHKRDISERRSKD